MARLNLIGGAYASRSVIANAQKCINYFPEANRRDAPTPMTHYQRPGRRALVQAGAKAKIRGLYQASNGNGYCVSGQSVYAISPGWVLTQIGALNTILDTQVSFIDNGIDILLVDGSAFGYTIHLADNSFSQIVDPTGTFTGATQVATLDTFVLWNYPGTKNFGSTLSNEISFNALYIAGKTAYPDPLIALSVNRREIILLGRLKGEIWYDVGGTSFPFALLPGAYIEHGCLAAFSIASYDIETYWLAQDLSGAYVVLKLRGYDVSKISNFALEWRLKQLALGGADLSKAVGFTWQQGGHAFYSLNLPGTETWVFDASLGDDPTLAWHQECTYVTGVATRMRDNCTAFLYGHNIVGDFANGWLYDMDPNYYYDDFQGASTPITCTRSFPHIVSAWNAETGAPRGPYSTIDLDGKRVQLSNFRLDLEVGLALSAGQQVGLRWSWDRGQTYGNIVLQDAGSPGAYMTQPLWTQIGATGRDCILEVEHSIVGPAALQGAWVDATALNT